MVAYPYKKVKEVVSFTAASAAIITDDQLCLRLSGSHQLRHLEE